MTSLTGQTEVRPTGWDALLMVLWISAALAAVAFSLANTVRGETDRTSTELDEVRGYYLATVRWTAPQSNCSGASDPPRGTQNQAGVGLGRLHISPPAWRTSNSSRKPPNWTSTAFLRNT